MKRVIILLICAILLASLCGCGDYATTGTTEETELTGTEFISIPGTLVAENFSFSIVSAEISNSVTLNSGVDISIDAEDGKQFLILCIDATNTSNEARNLGPFTTYVDDISVLPHNLLGKYGDRVLMGGAVHPGKTMKAYVLYQVPMEWEYFELCYVDTLTCKASDFVKFTRDDVNQ